MILVGLYQTSAACCIFATIKNQARFCMGDIHLGTLQEMQTRFQINALLRLLAKLDQWSSIQSVYDPIWAQYYLRRLSIILVNV